MENKSLSKPLILGASLVVGLLLLGLFIFKGLKTFSDKDRVVTVKGLAEMKIVANAASIDLNFSFSGDNLKEAIQLAENKKKAIVAYLQSSGYSNKEISMSNISVTDRQKYYELSWVDGKQVQQKVDRYTVLQSLSVKSNDVVKTGDKSSQIELDLISKDLTANVTTSYTFPELNSIKPKLIAESTRNARIAGEQFANDSQATLGKIKTASQGQITLAGEYSEEGDGGERPKEAYIQKARVVSTIVFFLE